MPQLKGKKKVKKKAKGGAHKPKKKGSGQCGRGRNGSAQKGSGLFDRTGFGSFLTHDIGGTGYFSGLANHIGGEVWTPTAITAGLKLLEAGLRANQL
jgi:hypothetical protein